MSHTLIDRIESATGPDRDLDAEIARALGFKIPNAPGRPFIAYSDGRPPEPIPAYTASIDTALSLMPEGWIIASLEWWPMRRMASVTLRAVKEADFGIGYGPNDGRVSSHAASIPRAILSAIMKARSL